MLKEDIKKELKKAIEKAGYKALDVVLERPEDSSHGDYASTSALVLAKELGKNPREVAENIVLKFKIRNLKFLDQIKVEGPGFINFFVKHDVFVKELQDIVKKKKKYGSNTLFAKKKVMVEFTDPNPFKEFHIGHLYSNIVGESLCKLFEMHSATVKRAIYQGDVGLHVAKAVWGMKELFKKEKTSLAILQKKSLQEKAEFLGKAYALGSQAYEKEAQEEVKELNVKIFAQDKSVIKLYEAGRKWSLQAFEQVYKRLGTKFNYRYLESIMGPLGIKIVEQGLAKGVFEKSQGAIIFPGEQYGLHSRVFINSQGLPTYEAKDLGLAPKKYKDFPYDLSVIITANEQKEYFKVVLAALQVMNPKLAEKTTHLSHGMIQLPQGKMSSRTGNIVTGEDLLDQVKEKVQGVMEQAGTKFSKKEQEQATESIAQAAVKYSFLKVGLGKDIVFDIENSLSLEGNSGPYVQYTYARCKSILRKANLKRLSFPHLSAQAGLKETKFTREEERLMRLLYQFPEVVQEATIRYSPSLVVSFAFEVAQAFNAFYHTNPVLKAEHKEEKEFRLLLTTATAQVLQNSLSLLGIKTLERM